VVADSVLGMKQFTDGYSGYWNVNWLLREY
jgi:hypothetical protein